MATKQDLADAVVDSGPAPAPHRSRCLHCTPPLTPAGFFAGRRSVLVGLAVTFVVLALGAGLSGGALLLTWDEPIQRAVEDARTAGLTAAVRRISFLGSTIVVVSLGAAMALLSWRRCRAVAVAVVVATLARPLLEFTLKLVVSRDRPDLERLVDGVGYSFPSGHAMAAVAVWGLVPVVVSLYARDRRVWWASLTMAGALIVAIGASRVYLGVHWFSDVAGGLIVGVFFLLGVEWVLGQGHRRDRVHCACPCASSRRATVPASGGDRTDSQS